MPTSEIFLNEKSFIGARPPDGKYVPLHWVHFGGPRGAHLPHLASMWIGSRGCLPTGIKFTYQETASIKPVYIGDHEEIEHVEMHPNSIDGPGGEYIQTVQAAMRDRVCALKVSDTPLSRISNLHIFTSIRSQKPMERHSNLGLFCLPVESPANVTQTQNM